MNSSFVIKEGGSAGMIIILGVLALTFISCFGAMIFLLCDCIG